MSNFGIILARGGSKGIPNKNILNVAGFPLISYTISAAKCLDDVYVSTDSDDISDIAKSYGAKILKRPKEFATDSSKSEDALTHFCENILCDNVVFIQPTSPLLEPDDIVNGLSLLDNYDSIFSGYKEHWIPRWDDNAPYDWDINQRPMRQDKKELIVENGAFYISSRENILKYENRYSGKIGYHLMPYSRSFQLDNYDDLIIINALLKNRN